MGKSLTPTLHCIVRTHEHGLARVVGLCPEQSPSEVRLRLKDGRFFCCSIGSLRSGFAPEMQVEHVPPRDLRSGLGVGTVLRVRTVAGFDQVLVQFAESGETRWLPFQTLRSVMSVEKRLELGALGKHDDHAERFRLRILAKALESWDSNTGAFGRLDIDPLPHQLHVAQKVVTSGEPNWLIADDVGLGKTIEVGLILHAMTQRNRCRRVLIVCPASLVQQWKEEMRTKFERAFEIYGKNFMPDYADELRLRDNVIVSLDLAKRDKHRDLIRSAGDWDVIIFDEAHRLGRSETGERTERYRLAEALRPMTPSLLLLTATPHQGKSRRFAALLELVRPDLKHEIANIEINPEVVGEIVIRNRKTKVTDASGKPIFRGHDTQRVMVEPSDPMRIFDRALQAYLRRGYNVGAKGGGQGRAIGFVMTTYRKLASSSIAAILRALHLRHDRLMNDVEVSVHGKSVEALLESGELESADDLADLRELYDHREFFEDEIGQVEQLLTFAKAAKSKDNKLERFLRDVMRPLAERNVSLLVFTEYRATQSYLAEAISAALPKIGEAALVHGSMSLEQKLESVARFSEGEARVLVSTEAGGEGLNLHQSCHVMVNYDLPWNPSRLVQRIGRLYRYGQTRRVQVINLQADDGFDNQAINLMFERVATISREMAVVAPENHEALADDILGELLSNIDMEAILERAQSLSIELTDREIEEAIESAKNARRIEQDILEYADGHAGPVAGGLENRHMLAFAEGMLPRIGAKIRSRTWGDRVLEVELPEQLVGRFPEFGRRQVVSLSADKSLARKYREILPLDFEGSLVPRLAELAKSRRFDGLYAAAAGGHGFALLGVYHLRWQDIDGLLLEDELVPIVLDAGGAGRRLSDEAFGRLLLEPLANLKANSALCGEDASMRLFEAFERNVSSVASDMRAPGSVFLSAALRSSV